MPVLAGAGGYDTREVIEAAQRMKRAGADGILSVDPVLQQARRRKGSSSTTARSPARSPLPIVVYNVPGRTGCNVEVATLARLSGVPESSG